MAKRFSGKASVPFWRAINRIEGPDHKVFSMAGCDAQELEAEVERLRKLEGTDDHPEHRCERCGGRNIRSWYADSDVWNRVAGDFSILCPICFSELAANAGIRPTAWRLSIEGDDPEVSKLRVRLHDRLEEAAKLETRAGQLQKHVLLLEANLGNPITIELLRQQVVKPTEDE